MISFQMFKVILPAVSSFIHLNIYAFRSEASKIFKKFFNKANNIDLGLGR